MEGLLWASQAVALALGSSVTFVVSQMCFFSMTFPPCNKPNGMLGLSSFLLLKRVCKLVYGSPSLAQDCLPTPTRAC